MYCYEWCIKERSSSTLVSVAGSATASRTRTAGRMAWRRPLTRGPFWAKEKFESVIAIYKCRMKNKNFLWWPTDWPLLNVVDANCKRTTRVWKAVSGEVRSFQDWSVIWTQFRIFVCWDELNSVIDEVCITNKFTYLIPNWLLSHQEFQQIY